MEIASRQEREEIAHDLERVTLDDATIASLVPVVRLQVERGGARLARLIEQTLG